MPEELGSLKPYKYTVEYRDGDVEYYFKTGSDVFYSCYFTSASGYFDAYPLIKDDIVTFGFRPTTFSKGFFMKKYDARIKQTIFQILMDVVRKHPEWSILVMYDTQDGRQRNRKIAFNRWYNEYCNLVSSRVTRISILAQGFDGSSFNLMMLVPNTCSKLELIKSTCIEIKDEFISKGYPPSIECRIECK